MPKTAYLFPGQGAQTVGMGAALAAAHPAAKARFDAASEVLGYDLLELCTHGPAEKLNATDVSQPAIYVASLAALDTYAGAASDDVDCAAGLSLGEYTALCCAGAFDFLDGVRLVQARGKAMQAAADASPSAMVSLIGPTVEEVENLVAGVKHLGTIQVANLLCPGNTVVSGTLTAVEGLLAQAEARGDRAVRLAVAGAFHTSLMRPADEVLDAALAGVNLRAARLPVYSNVDALPHTDPAEIRPLLVRQVVSPVLWEATLRAMLARGVERFVEIGPGRVLAGLLKRVHRKAEVVNVGA